MSGRATSLLALFCASLCAATARAEGPAGLRAEIGAGAGLGTRSFVRPTTEGIQRLGVAPFPAVDLGLALEGPLGPRWTLGAGVRYRTSLGLSVEERPAFALPNEIDVRAQRLELGVVPCWRFGADARALALAVPVGFALRTFAAEVQELATPTYNLAGPYLRAELVAPLGPGVTLRVGPEAHLLLFVGRALRNGGVESTGIALGAEASLRVALDRSIALEADYRESHALAGHVDDGESFEDVERFATARITGAF